MFEILTKMCWDIDRNARDIDRILKILTEIHEKWLHFCDYFSDYFLVITVITFLVITQSLKSTIPPQTSCCAFRSGPTITLQEWSFDI